MLPFLHREHAEPGFLFPQSDLDQVLQDLAEGNSLFLEGFQRSVAESGGGEKA